MMPLPGNISDAPFEVGEEIAGRYTVERAIAEGGMGLIMAARHVDLDEVVAIKFLKPEFARQQEIIGRFAREAKACTKIKSEYVVKVIDVGVSPNRGPYMVMEYLEGEDLSEHLAREGRLAPERAVEFVLQTCEALANAHALGIIHRDIKPENFFLVRNEHDVPTVKVLDFGVSKTALTGKIFGNEINVAKTQALLGTPLYMSPEQLRGQIDVDATADVWSLGAVLYELITGEAPFSGGSVTEVCASVLETVPRPPSERSPELPLELQAVIMKCLEKTPGKRYKTVAELAVALQPFGPKRARMCVERAIAAAKAANQVPISLQSVPSLAPPSGAPSSTRTPSPISIIAPQAAAPAPSRAKLGLVAGAVVVLIAIAGISFAMRGGSAPSKPTAAEAPATTTAAPTPTTPPSLTAAAEPTGGTPTAPTQAPETTPAARPGTNPTVPNWGRAPIRPGGGGVVAAPPSVAKTPSAVTPSAPPPTPGPTTNSTRATAIDDRK